MLVRGEIPFGLGLGLGLGFGAQGAYTMCDQPSLSVSCLDHAVHLAIRLAIASVVFFFSPSHQKEA